MPPQQMIITDKELAHLVEIKPGEYNKDDLYVGYVVPADGPVGAKRNGVYDQECLEAVYNPSEIYLYGIPSIPDYQEKQCIYCRKQLANTYQRATATFHNP